MDLISIIVPIYNVESFLNRCILSIVNQSFDNIEIILVNDGSTDNSYSICKEWETKDHRIKLINKTNGGLSDARNAGLKVATGKYIAFVDSDDWIDKKYIEVLYSAIKNTDCEISACDIKHVYDDSPLSCDIETDYNIEVYSSEKAIDSLIHGVTFRAVAWNKLYSASLLQNEFFEKGKYHEDEFFTYRILGKANKLAYINAQLYYYYQRPNSIMNSISPKHLDALDAYVERINFLKIHYPALYLYDKKRFCTYCVMFYNESKNISDDMVREYKKRIKNCRKKISFSMKELKTTSFKEKAYIFGSRYCIGLFCKLL